MSAAEDDTELRDLLIQNLENSGVLNKLKAEMRAAVFLAMEDQDRLENKTPLVNENLKKCLNSKDGRLVASLIVDFLQVFNLDFSLAVFQPEINLLNGLDSRDLVCRELGLSDSELNKNSPLLLELLRRGRHGDGPDVPAEGGRSGNIPKELPQKQLALARKTFDFYDKDQSGSVGTEDLTSVFSDLLPGLNRNLLERFTSDELRAADRTFSDTVDFQFFLETYKHLFSQCRSVVVQDSDGSRPQNQVPEDKVVSPPVSKDPERSFPAGKGDLQPQTSSSSSAGRKEHLDLDLDLEEEEDHDEGDSFFDDPLPNPQKTYGCQTSPVGEKDPAERTAAQNHVVPQREEGLSGPPVSPMRRGRSLSDLSVLAGDSERDEPGSDPSSELRKPETSGTRGSPVGFLPEEPRPGGGGGGGGGGSTSEPSLSRNGAKGLKGVSDRAGSLHLDDEDVEYDDDFNSHRSDLSNGELSIGEEIEEVSIEGPENSEKLDETTEDLSVSQLSQSHGADYMEDVS
ncbi:FGFR1 oncogene partner isoform X2 [Kryptolebias marmoratus]|uniref:Centrosomal protein 43 n=1 Tax=Kryptolebias marmoratus TaxID=37003 RepID=A0A3Q2ZHG9_KRYMA|nr:FGFR1 oncogene partner isoform X2 [Kryptolebias marmoratus]